MVIIISDLTVNKQSVFTDNIVKRKQLAKKIMKNVLYLLCICN